MEGKTATKKKETVVKKGFKTMGKDSKSADKIQIPGIKKRSNRRKARKSKGKGIIYIGSIPHGFYEDEMTSYFNQFGKVLGAVVARSKKTGRSKGYGFVEFEDEEVAKIAAETMNNYLMFNRIIKCRYIPQEERKGKIFESRISSRNYPRQKNRKVNLQNNLKALSNLTQSSYLEKVQSKVKQFQKFFQEKGIDFTFQLKSSTNNLNDENKKSEITNKLKPATKSASQDDPDSEFGVLEIDESENEISFKTPPKVKKVIKKSVNASKKELTSPVNSRDKTSNLSKKSTSNKTTEKKTIKQEKKAVPGISQKLKKKTNEKKKLVKTLKTKKNVLVKDNTQSKETKSNRKVGNIIEKKPAKVIKKKGKMK